MAEDVVERLAFYHVLANDRVVQPVTITPEYITVRDPVDDTRWTLRAVPFREALRDGDIERVSPEWTATDEASA